jgi:K+-sensing histidine kinase KdpD
MQLYLETITKRELPESTKAELFNGMRTVNQRLKSLVYNFLESARLSSKQRPYTFSAISLPQLISSYIINNEVFLKDVELHIHALDNTILVLVDSDALEMVFSNLIENAIHYSTISPKVEIKMWKEERWAFVEFSDRGIGIPEEQHRDVFKMFKRLPEGASLWGSGTGMGLYVVKAIIKAHGGNIRVNVVDKGEGTSFRIRLPLARS